MSGIRDIAKYQYIFEVNILHCVCLCEENSGELVLVFIKSIKKI